MRQQSTRVPALRLGACHPRHAQLHAAAAATRAAEDHRWGERHARSQCTPGKLTHL